MNENISKIGKKFTSEYQPPNRGRKKSIYTKLAKSNLSKKDIINVFKLILEQHPKQLKKDYDKVRNMDILKETNDKPMIYYNIVAALFKDLKSGNLNNVMSILTRWLGYPKAEIIEEIGLSEETLKKLENIFEGKENDNNS